MILTVTVTAGVRRISGSLAVSWSGGYASQCYSVVDYHRESDGTRARLSRSPGRARDVTYYLKLIMQFSGNRDSFLEIE